MCKRACEYREESRSILSNEFNEFIFPLMADKQNTSVDFNSLFSK